MKVPITIPKWVYKRKVDGENKVLNVSMPAGEYYIWLDLPDWSLSTAQVLAQTGKGVFNVANSTIALVDSFVKDGRLVLHVIAGSPPLLLALAPLLKIIGIGAVAGLIGYSVYEILDKIQILIDRTYIFTVPIILAFILLPGFRKSILKGFK